MKMGEKYSIIEKIRDILLSILMFCLIIPSAYICRFTPILGSFIAAVFIMIFISCTFDIILKLHKNARNI